MRQPTRATLSRRQILLDALVVCTVAGSLGRTLAATLSSPKPSATVSIEAFDPNGVSQGVAEVSRVMQPDEAWRQQLSPRAYAVTRHENTEAPFSGEYDHNHADGLYRCICCDTALFDSRTKFDSGTGWPSFWKPISRYNVAEKADNSFGMQRTAVACRRCDAHLGHVFPDGPAPTGLRYCMNSVALKFYRRARVAPAHAPLRDRDSSKKGNEHMNDKIGAAAPWASMVPACLVLSMGVAAQANSADSPAKQACPASDAGITLSPGFCATVFADNLGHARHLVVTPSGVVYVNTWSGVYYANDKPPNGGFLVALRDANADGRAEQVQRFGDGVPQGSAGGTGIALYKGFLYAEQNDKIIRYKLVSGALVPKDAPEVVLSGLPLTGDHPMHPFVIDSKGNLFVDLGSATNTCEEHNRMPGSKGLTPCTEQEIRGGTWRYDANKLGQKFSPAERYATGIRNGEGMSFDAAGRMYVTQHGRDQLGENWPSLYRPEQGHELPAEEVVMLQQGGDYGWPRCYFDGAQKKLVLAPEYGGDGGKTVGDCAQKLAPVAFFPAHWAPNDLLIYTAQQFPSPYRGGAFIAFHGSWNRAPAPQGGYSVVYQPFADGKASGNYVVFADGFAGPEKAPGRATYRPSGLAVGPDGALYISDDVKGRIWRVTYNPSTPVTQIASAAAPKTAATSGTAGPPEGIHPDAGLPIPRGATAEQVALGDRIFHGRSAGGTCSGCHASDAKGTQLGADLTKGKWLWSDGSLAGLTDTITQGVPVPKQALGAMPPLGGSQLSKEQVEAVAAYVWAVGHNGH